MPDDLYPRSHSSETVKKPNQRFGMFKHRLKQSVQDRYLIIATGEFEVPAIHSIRQYTDQCKLYKILNGYYEKEADKFFILSNRTLQSPS